MIDTKSSSKPNAPTQTDSLAEEKSVANQPVKQLNEASVAMKKSVREKSEPKKKYGKGNKDKNLPLRLYELFFFWIFKLACFYLFFGCHGWYGI